MSPDVTMTFTLARDAFGRLVLTDAQGVRHEGVTPVRAFPIEAPDEGLSLVGEHGHELAWVDRLAQLPPKARQLVDEELAQHEFVPEIQRILAVSTFSTPSIWTVDTDRGQTTLVLKVEEDIRRLAGAALLISSGQGVPFLIRDRWVLDASSRRLLERFL